jgi:hypothetical protein
LQRSIPDLERMFSTCCAGLDAQESRELSRLLIKLNNSLDFSGAKK